jgi:sorting nexin-8
VIYLITSTYVHKAGPVLRRYSDFLWLQELLLKRYPFRTVTSLPPKKAVGTGPAFLERRRRGLIRFLNCIANHPVLSLDDVYISFMTYSAVRFTIKFSLI